jgi:CRISPR/Cas system-associated endonuclease Cas1
MENNLLNNGTVRETYRLTSEDPRSAAIAGHGNAWGAGCYGARALESLGGHEARIARTLFKTIGKMTRFRRTIRPNPPGNP